MSRNNIDYDLWLTTEPVDPKQDYIDNKVEKLLEDQEYLIGHDWFWEDCVNWEKVSEKLENQVKEDLEEQELNRKLDELGL